VVHVAEPIDPNRPHRFRNTLGGNCASCSWPEWHRLHKLNGRRFPYKHAKVRLLSVPHRAFHKHLMHVGMEGKVILGPKWYDTLYGGRPMADDAMVVVAFGKLHVWVAARQLLVLE
jgi:hypothetical protein